MVIHVYDTKSPLERYIFTSNANAFRSDCTGSRCLQNNSCYTVTRWNIGGIPISLSFVHIVEKLRRMVPIASRYAIAFYSGLHM